MPETSLGCFRRSRSTPVRRPPPESQPPRRTRRSGLRPLSSRLPAANKRQQDHIGVPQHIGLPACGTQSDTPTPRQSVRRTIIPRLHPNPRSRSMASVTVFFSDIPCNIMSQIQATRRVSAFCGGERSWPMVAHTGIFTKHFKQDVTTNMSNVQTAFPVISCSCQGRRRHINLEARANAAHFSSCAVTSARWSPSAIHTGEGRPTRMTRLLLVAIPHRVRSGSVKMQTSDTDRTMRVGHTLDGLKAPHSPPSSSVCSSSRPVKCPTSPTRPSLPARSASSSVTSLRSPLASVSSWSLSSTHPPSLCFALPSHIALSLRSRVVLMLAIDET